MPSKARPKLGKRMWSLAGAAQWPFVPRNEVLDCELAVTTAAVLRFPAQQGPRRTDLAASRSPVGCHGDFPVCRAMDAYADLAPLYVIKC